MNDEEVFKVNLRKSLELQDTAYELILVDNRSSRFNSIPAGLNYGGNSAAGDYIVFVHQDVYLNGISWLRNLRKCVKNLSDMGVAGVAGVDDNGNYVGFVQDRGELWGSPLEKVISAQTLDEQLLVVPKKQFEKMKFDESFSFHSYGADYCLSAKKSGYKVYVLPLFTKHNSVTVASLNAGDLTIDNLRLLQKNWAVKDGVYKTAGGRISSRSISEKCFHYLLDNAPSCITKLLIEKREECAEYLSINKKICLSEMECDFILDSGSIPLEQIKVKSLMQGNYSVGISNDKAYLVASKKTGVHKEYVLCNIDQMPFREKSFCTGILVGVLEYLPQNNALKRIHSVERVCKQIVVIVPNSCFPKSKAYRNFYSNWNANILKKLGYKVGGMNFRRLGQFGICFEVFMPTEFLWALHLSVLSSKLIGFKNSNSLFER
jgi:hypothetical protein